MMFTLWALSIGATLIAGVGIGFMLGVLYA